MWKPCNILIIRDSKRVTVAFSTAGSVTLSIFDGPQLEMTATEVANAVTGERGEQVLAVVQLPQPTAKNRPNAVAQAADI